MALLTAVESLGCCTLGEISDDYLSVVHLLFGTGSLNCETLIGHRRCWWSYRSYSLSFSELGMESSTTGLARVSDSVLTVEPEVEDAKTLKRREVERELSRGDVTGGSMSLGWLAVLRFGGLRMMSFSVIDLSLSDDEPGGSNSARPNVSVCAEKTSEEDDALAGLLDEVRRERRRGLGGRNGGLLTGQVLAKMDDLVCEAQRVMQKEAARVDGRSEVDKAHEKLLNILSDLEKGTDAAKMASSTPPPEIDPISRCEGSELENVHKLGTYTEKRWVHWFRDEVARGVFEAGLRELGVVKGMIEDGGKELEDGKDGETSVSAEGEGKDVDEEGTKKTEEGKGAEPSVVAEAKAEGIDDDGGKESKDGKVEVLNEGDQGTEIDELNPSQYQTPVPVENEDDDVDQLGPSQYVMGGRLDTVVDTVDVESETGSGKVASGEVAEKEVEETGHILVGRSVQGAMVEEEVDQLRASQYDVQSGDVGAGESCAVEGSEDVRREEESEDVDQLRPSQYEDGAGLTEAQEFEDIDQLRPSQYENDAGLTEVQGVVTGAGDDEERIEGSSKLEEMRVRDVSFDAFIWDSQIG